MKKLFLFLALCLTFSVFSQVIIEDPIFDIGQEWKSHQIQSFHFTPYGGFAFLDDSSVWMINDEDLDWIQERQEKLLDTPITIMPEAGVEEFPTRIIVHNEKELGWKDFTIKYILAPTSYHALHICSIDTETGSTLSLLAETKEDSVEIPLYINPVNDYNVKKWKKGQCVIIGGIWLPEYDPNEHKEYSSTYLYVLFNYDTQDYVFFAL